MVIIYSILLGKFSEGKAMIDLYHNLIIVILICHLKGEIVILLFSHLGVGLWAKNHFVKRRNFFCLKSNAKFKNDLMKMFLSTLHKLNVSLLFTQLS